MEERLAQVEALSEPPSVSGLMDAFQALRDDLDCIRQRVDALASNAGRMASELARMNQKPQNNSELLDQAPPCDLDAERAVLACLLLKPEKISELRDELTQTDFGDEALRTIYGAMLWLDRCGKLVDATLLVAELRESGQYNVKEGISVETLAGLFRLHPLLSCLTWHVERVKEMSRRRHAIERGIQLVQAASQPISR